jgi:pimeloyl-ACP methyl ester carboxylesterase
MSQITCPVTWIHGREDKIVAYSVGEESLPYFESKAELIPIEDAGHASFMDQPKVFHTIITGILQTIE